MAPNGVKSKGQKRSGKIDQSKGNSQKDKNQKRKYAASDAKSSLAPPRLQQAILDVFAVLCGAQDAEELRERIQKVKGCLYNRDFDAAFATTENQEAYCLRWSPSRALAYTELLCSIPDVSELLRSVCAKSSPDRQLNVICIGGGAGAEAVAFAAGLHHVASRTVSKVSNEESESQTRTAASILLNAVDIADWSSVLLTLDSGTRNTLATTAASSTRENLTRPQQSSATETELDQVAEVTAEIETTLNLGAKPAASPDLRFHKADVLTMPSSELAALISPTSISEVSSPSLSTAEAAQSPSVPALITIMFTLNELYTTSMPLTTTFLLTLTRLTSPGTLLLVVDSPGSYSTVKLNGAEKTYPMQWLLDHTLLTTAAKEKGSGPRANRELQKWEKVGAEESRWWRMDRETLRYRVPGVELEDMRMQWHLFRRV